MEGKPVCSKCLKTHWVGQACKAEPPFDPAVHGWRPADPVPIASAAELADELLEGKPKFDRSAAMKASWARRKSGAQDPSP